MEESRHTSDELEGLGNTLIVRHFGGIVEGDWFEEWCSAQWRSRGVVDVECRW